MKTPKSHPREWVDCSDPTYISGFREFTNPTNGSWWIVQIQPIRPHRRIMKLNSLLNARLVSEAGSEQSTNFPLVGFKNSLTARCRLDLK